MHLSLATCCSWTRGVRVLWALGTMLQPGSVWGHMDWQCLKKDVRGGGSWFWGPGDNTMCARPTDQGVHPLLLEPDGIWHRPAALQPPENRVWARETGLALAVWSSGVACGWGALGLAGGGRVGPAFSPPHIPSCSTAWHGELKERVHVCCCTHDCACTRVCEDCARVGVIGCARHRHPWGGTGWRPLQPPLPDVLQNPVRSSSQ